MINKKKFRFIKKSVVIRDFFKSTPYAIFFKIEGFDNSDLRRDF